MSTQGASPSARYSAPINLTEEVRVREELEATNSKENSIRISSLLDTAFGYQLVMCEEVSKYDFIRPLSV